MKKAFLLLMVFGILFSGFLSTPLVLAQDTNDYNRPSGLVSCQANCTVCDFIFTLDNVIDFAVKLSFALVVLFVAFAGVMMMLSQGDKSKFEQSKKMITTAVWGIVIVLLSWIIVDQLLSLMAGNGFDFSIWNQIPCSVPK